MSLEKHLSIVLCIACNGDHYPSLVQILFELFFFSACDLKFSHGQIA
jgi:hypothetical protein